MPVRRTFTGIWTQVTAHRRAWKLSRSHSSFQAALWKMHAERKMRPTSIGSIKKPRMFSGVQKHPRLFLCPWNQSDRLRNDQDQAGNRSDFDQCGFFVERNCIVLLRSTFTRSVITQCVLFGVCWVQSHLVGQSH